MTPAAGTRSRILAATAYAHSLTAARDITRAIEGEDIPGALAAVTLWAAWIEETNRVGGAV